MNQRFIFLVLIATILSLPQCRIDEYAQGERLYLFHCAPCHMNGGEGLGNLYPPIVNSDYLLANLSHLPCIIRYGIQDTIIVNGVLYDQPMAGIKELNDIEIHNITNYIMKSMLQQDTVYTFKNVEEKLKNCL